MACVTDLPFVALAVPDIAAEREFVGKTCDLVEVGEKVGMVYFATAGGAQ